MRKEADIEQKEALKKEWASCNGEMDAETQSSSGSEEAEGSQEGCHEGLDCFLETAAALKDLRSCDQRLERELLAFRAHFGP